MFYYRKNRKISDNLKICCNHPKSWTKWLYFCVMCSEDADRMANSVDPDQTAPRSSLIWVCTVCPVLSVRKLRIITVNSYPLHEFLFCRRQYMGRFDLDPGTTQMNANWHHSKFNKSELPYFCLNTIQTLCHHDQISFLRHRFVYHINLRMNSWLMKRKSAKFNTSVNFMAYICFHTTNTSFDFQSCVFDNVELKWYHKTD